LEGGEFVSLDVELQEGDRQVADVRADLAQRSDAYFGADLVATLFVPVGNSAASVNNPAFSRAK
jgi:hypothetical protein